MKLSTENTVYIAGPMSGMYLLNYPAFYAMEGLLRKTFQCRVLNPARQPDGLEYEEYMNRAFADLQQADTIVLLDGWNKSPGAKREFSFAVRRGIRTVAADEVFRTIHQRLKVKNPAISIKDR